MFLFVGDWWRDPATIFGGLAMVAVFVAVMWFVLVSINRSGKKYKQNNPDAATIWIVLHHTFGVEIKKVDGVKPKKSMVSIASGPANVYVMPGKHLISMEHVLADPEANKDPEYRKRKFSDMSISVEAGKDYTLHYSEEPGDYLLVEGKPELA